MKKLNIKTLVLAALLGALCYVSSYLKSRVVQYLSPHKQPQLFWHHYSCHQLALLLLNSSTSFYFSY